MSKVTNHINSSIKDNHRVVSYDFKNLMVWVYCPVSNDTVIGTTTSKGNICKCGKHII